jgi:hypothetical protein
MKAFGLPSILSAVIAIGGACEARAQGDNNAAFQAFARTQFYQGLISRQFAAIPPDVFQRCPSLVSQGSQIKVLRPVIFAADGFPIDGLWKQSFPVGGCGNDTVLNFYFHATAAEKIDVVIAAPGDTHANLALQQDASRYAMIGALDGRKDCSALNIKTTKFEAYGLKKPYTPDPGPGQPMRPWWESWTMVGCGHTYVVPLNFIPDANGTTIVQPRGAVEQ